jgi:hypothetical protein
MTNATRVRRVLRNLGYSDASITAAWPYWWTDDAESSPSAQAELRFTLARNLGLDARSFFEEDGAPRFVWHDEARFKQLRAEDEGTRAALASFGMSLARIIAEVSREAAALTGVSAGDLRASVLQRQPFVRLLDLLGICWAVGHPVIHLRVFPMAAKRMAAMTVMTRSQPVILLGKDARYPAPIAFYVAHELGHLALGHVPDGHVLVDLERTGFGRDELDDEELAADRFALELLTGSPTPVVLPNSNTFSARSLAASALASSAKLRIEPGTLALCLGHATGDWRRANSALPRIYDSPRPVWREVNRVAVRELDLAGLTEESRSYLSAVMGLAE